MRKLKNNDIYARILLKQRRARQQGVSLLIAMMMLVIIGLMSVAVMRNALSADQVAINAKAQAQATQYAIAAERFCELKFIHGDAHILPLGQPPQWTLFGHWFPAAGAVAYTLASADLALGDGIDIVAPTVLPQCLIEKTAVGVTPAWIITARGFSTDYSADGQGSMLAGAVSWVQTVVNSPAAGMAAAVRPQQAQGLPGSPASTPARVITDRVWRQLLTPPSP